MNVESFLKDNFLLELIFIFVIGLCLGSFYTACASRVLFYFYGEGRRGGGRWRRFFLERSFCMSCKTKLKPIELIPIFSFLYLRGRCKSCQSSIGLSTLVGEVFIAIVFVLEFYFTRHFFFSLLITLFAGHLWISIRTDWEHLILDYENTIFLYVIAILSLFFLDTAWISHSLTMAACILIFLLLHFLSKRVGLGFADIWLAGAIGLLLGMPWTLISIEAAAAASIIYAYAIRKDKRSPIAFGAFLSVSCIITMIARDAYYFLF